MGFENMKTKKLSIIVPFFNEETNIPRIVHEALTVFASALSSYSFEIILMDNHSTDGSFMVACAQAQKHPEIKVIRLSRNFGYQANILTGYLHCTGDAAVQLDADGEDDPVLIADLVREWEAGHQVVYGIRRKREEGFFIRFQRAIFYRILRSLSSIPIPVDAGDFRLVDRKVIEVLRLCRESNPYLRGLISFAGYQQKGIPYDRRPRYDGKSKFSWWDYFSLALDGITSFSKKPLAIASWLGLLFSLTSFLGAVFYFLFHFLVGTKLPGFTTLILVNLFLAGIQLLCFGIIGTYIGRIFDETKSRPRSLVEATYPTDLKGVGHVS